MTAIDPAIMKELVQAFVEEGRDLLGQLVDILCEYDAGPNPKIFEQYGQIIDRMMGAAKSLDLKVMGLLCEYGKTIGYKQSQMAEENMMTITVGILEELNEVLARMFQVLSKEGVAGLAAVDHHVVQSRLDWISAKLKHIERASCATDSNKPVAATAVAKKR